MSSFSPSQSILWSPRRTSAVCFVFCRTLPNSLLTNYPVVPGLPSNVQPLSSGLYTSMRPFASPIPDKAIEATDKFHPVISGKQPLEFSPFLSRSIDRARKNVAGILSKKDFEPVEHADIGIIPLGTGGSVPSKYRNGA